MKNMVAILGVVLLCVVCEGRIIIVDDDGGVDFDNIQAAIDDANDGDTIYVFPGIYTGAGNRDIDFGGRAITVQSVAPSDPYIVAATVIDCQAAGRGFYFHSEEGTNSVVSGLTIANGYADYGGALYCNSSSPTITNCVIMASQAQQQGGGVYLYASEAGIINCTFNGNSANVEGGGLCCIGWYRATVTNSEFISNSATDNGGAVYNEDSRLEMSGCVFKGNSAGAGGGLYKAGGGELRATNCTFSGNRADSGGGGYCLSSWIELKNCTLSGNSAVSAGGGLYCQECEPFVSHCIVWGNTDASGSGQAAQMSGGTPYVEFSCIQDDDPNDGNIPFGGAAQNNIDDDPLFVREPNDGGDGWGAGGNDDFGDLHIEDGSPCVNAGDPYLWIGPGSTDIDGQPRIMGEIIDMGADEFHIPRLIVTKPAGGEVWASNSWHEIIWESEAYEGTVNIEFSEDTGSNWQSIESGTADTGSYMWHLSAGVDSNQCLIAVVPSVPDANVIIIESGLFTIHPDSPGPAVESEWRTLGGDFERRGLSENAGVELGCVKWEFEVDGAISASVTVGPNDVLYVPCEDGNLYCLDSNGVLLWSYEANTPLISSASIGADGTAYVGGRNGRLYAVDKNGSVRWTHTTGGFVYSSPAVGGDGKVFVGSEDGKVYGLGPDGSELWSFETGGFGVIGGSVLASPSLGPDGTVYVGGLYDSNLYALEPNDANVKWVCHFDSNGWCFASPVIGPNGTIYQTLLYDPNLYAIDPNDGNIISQTNLSEVGLCWGYYSPWFEPYEYLGFTAPCLMERWCGICLYGYGTWMGPPPKYNLSDSGWSEPALGPDGTIYVNLDDPWLRAVEPNGAMKWAVELGSTGGFSLTVGAGGLIYAASSDSNLYVVHPDGYEVARFDSNDHWLGFPVVSAENTVIVGDARDNTLMLSYENNKVWAIGPCQGQEADMYWQGGREDLDGDGDVDYADVKMMAEDWLKCTDCGNWQCCDRNMEEPYSGDLNNDRYINFADFALMAQRWLMGY